MLFAFLGTYRAITVSVILEKFYFSFVVISRLVLAKTWHYIGKVLKEKNNIFRTEFYLTTWVFTRDSSVTLRLLIEAFLKSVTIYRALAPSGKKRRQTQPHVITLTRIHRKIFSFQ